MLLVSVTPLETTALYKASAPMATRPSMPAIAVALGAAPVAAAGALDDPPATCKSPLSEDAEADADAVSVAAHCC